MRTVLYMLAQCTWGILQTLSGFVVFLICIRDKHYLYHGAVVTEWKFGSSVSLGLFVFVSANPYYRGIPSKEETASRLLVHEYGHTIQSLILGPLYFFVTGIPSIVWASAPALHKMRRKKQLSYFSFYTERWANYLGEKVTKTKSMGQLFID